MSENESISEISHPQNDRGTDSSKFQNAIPIRISSRYIPSANSRRKSLYREYGALKRPPPPPKVPPRAFSNAAKGSFKDQKSPDFSQNLTNGRENSGSEKEATNWIFVADGALLIVKELVIYRT